MGKNNSYSAAQREAMAREHSISKEDAELLLGLALLPLEMRVLGLRRLVLEQRGPEAVLSLLASVIGLSNQVCDSTRQWFRESGFVKPEIADAMNLPTMSGAFGGIRNAIKPVRGMCSGCAFRQGSPANQSPDTMWEAMLAVQGMHGFDCHEDMKDGEATRRCAGFLASKGKATPAGRRKRKASDV